MKKMCDEGNQIHNFMSSSGSGTVSNYSSGSDFLTSYGSGYSSGSTSQKVTVLTVPVPQHCREPLDTKPCESCGLGSGSGSPTLLEANHFKADHEQEFHLRRIRILSLSLMRIRILITSCA
jgi:hypothetical protein